MAEQVLIVGCTGQLGTEMVRVCEQRGYAITALARRDLDVTSSHHVEQTLAEIRPSLVLNATAYNLVDKAEAEPEAVMAANVLAVRNLAVACARTHAQLVHVSTDYVFDGSIRRPYVETDPTRPLGAYGVSKLAGEYMALAYAPKPLIVRTCGVFGVAGLATGRGNFVETMLRLASQQEPIRVVADATASPTLARELAVRILDLVGLRAHGIFHLGGGQPVSWFEYAAMIFDQAGLNPSLRPVARRDYKTPAERPLYSALSNAKAEALGITPMPPLRACIGAYLRERASVLSSTPAAV